MGLGYVNGYLPDLYCALATEILCDSNRDLFESIVCLGRPAIGLLNKGGESGNYYYRRAHTRPSVITQYSPACIFA